MGAGLNRAVIEKDLPTGPTLRMKKSLPELNELQLPESRTTEELILNVFHINHLLSQAPYYIVLKDSMVNLNCIRIFSHPVYYWIL